MYCCYSLWLEARVTTSLDTSRGRARERELTQSAGLSSSFPLPSVCPLCCGHGAVCRRAGGQARAGLGAVPPLGRAGLHRVPQLGDGCSRARGASSHLFVVVVCTAKGTAAGPPRDAGCAVRLPCEAGSRRPGAGASASSLSLSPAAPPGTGAVTRFVRVRCASW